jgi:hypothetical protein
LIEDGGKYFLTETQKDVARVHEIDPALLEGLWSQFDAKAVATAGLLLDLAAPLPESVRAPALPAFLRRSTRMDYGREDLRAGFSVDLWVRFASLAPGQILIDNRNSDGRGFALRTAENGAVEIVLNDATTENRWSSDPGTIMAGQPQHIVAIVDGGPKIVTFVIDGKLCDGGEARPFGWGRFSPHLASANGAPDLRIGARLDGRILRLRMYNRYLRTSEAVAAFRAGH